MTIKPRILFHSECSFFAGCERMLINFFNDQDLRSEFDISFVTGNSMRYIDELTALHQPDFDVCQLRFPKQYHPSQDFKFAPRIVSVLCRKVTEVLYRIPLVVIDTMILLRHVRKVNPDIVHINNGGYPGNTSSRAMVFAARIAGVRNIIMVVNNQALDYIFAYRWFDRPVDWLISRSISNFITGARSSAMHLASILRMPHEKVLSFSNGVVVRAAAESVSQTRGRLGIDTTFSGLIGVVISRFEKRKGHAVLIDAVQDLIAEREINSDDLLLLLEGNGPELASILDTISLTNISSVVRCIGDEQNIANLYNVADFLILPSIGEEDFPNVVLEAMSYGKCVIASNLAGIPEQVIDGVTGMLVQPSDAKSLGRAISKIILDPKVMRSMGAEGRNRFEREFTVKLAVQRYVALYRRMLSEK